MHLDVRKNFEEKVSYVARRLNGMMVDDQSNFLSVDCGLPSDTFNVIVVRDLRVMDPVLASVDRFISKGFPFAVWYWESDIDKSDISYLVQHGLVHTETHKAMYADLSQIQIVPLHVEGLEIKQVMTDSDMLHFGEVIAALFGDSSEGRQVFTYFQRLCTYPLSMFPDMRYYLGTFRGKVVAIGTLFVGSQTVGIYDIVTHNDYRRRGIGNAMFQYLLKEANASNRRFAVLQASNDGLGIYLKAGFRMTGDVLTFEVRG
jgi:ribosomal protein S18 acetylase RimI-like enzyme